MNSNDESMPAVLEAKWKRGPYVVSAEWHGGAYVELTMPECTEATEVINVWNYETGEAKIPFTQEALQECLATWCEDSFGTSNPDGAYNLQAYIENGSY